MRRRFSNLKSQISNSVRVNWWKPPSEFDGSWKTFSLRCPNYSPSA
jgi:hypothetical protein